MPHHMIDEILSRRGEKVAVFLTVQNVTGLVLGAVPIFLMCFQRMPWYITFPATILGGLIGLMLTLDIRGMVTYERIFWTIRGALQQRVKKARIAPEDISGIKAITAVEAIPLDGSIRVVQQPRRTRARPVVQPQRDHKTHAVEWNGYEVRHADR